MTIILAVNFSRLLVIKTPDPVLNPDPDGYSAKMLGPDSKHWIKYAHNYLCSVCNSVFDDLFFGPCGFFHANLISRLCCCDQAAQRWVPASGAGPLTVRGECRHLRHQGHSFFHSFVRSFVHSFILLFHTIILCGIRCLFDPWIRDPGWVESQHPDPGWTTRIIFSRA